uniref:Secreted protein n=1 Tax=Haemonchus placei TaxID=6290 RepID=A0A0N4VX52_HAEPC
QLDVISIFKKKIFQKTHLIRQHSVRSGAFRRHHLLIGDRFTVDFLTERCTHFTSTVTRTWAQFALFSSSIIRRKARICSSCSCPTSFCCPVS